MILNAGLLLVMDYYYSEVKASEYSLAQLYYNPKLP